MTSRNPGGRYLLAIVVVIATTVGAIAFLAHHITQIREALPINSLQRERDFSVLMLDVARLESALNVYVAAGNDSRRDELNFALDLVWLRLRDNRALYAGENERIDAIHTGLESIVASLENSLAQPSDERKLQHLLNQVRQLRAELQLLNDTVFQDSIAQATEQRYHLARFRDAMLLLIFLAGFAALVLVLLLLQNHRHLEAVRLNEKLLGEAKAAAEAANLAKSRFLATMSHEIRTPLNGVLGMAQLLREKHISESERIEFARTILSSGQSLLSLLNDVLDLAKIESGKLRLEPGRVSPAQLLRETQTLFSALAVSKNLELTSVWHGGDESYLADPHRLRQMLSNLVGNAIKFTPSGKVHVEAREVSRQGKHAVLEFSVRDTGIGVAPEDLSRLFEPFSQVDDSTIRQYGGTGLGLSIVRNLAEMMGGETGVESSPGQGSCFWFRIRADVLPSET